MRVQPLTKPATDTSLPWKTTILYKLHSGAILTTVPPIGFNVEKVHYKNVVFTVWDVGGQETLRPLWRHYFNNTDALIFVVDSQDRERIGKSAAEFQAIIQVRDREKLYRMAHAPPCAPHATLRMAWHAWHGTASCCTLVACRFISSLLYAPPSIL